MKVHNLVDLSNKELSSYSGTLKTDNIGANIRYFRVEHAKMTQEEFAKEIHVTRSTLANYELIRRTIPINELIRIADIFNISLDVLCYRKNYLERQGIKNENLS